MTSRSSYLLLAGAALVAAAAGALWFASAPQRLDAALVEDMPTGDAARGEMVFWAAGCASCHAESGATGDDRLVLAGGTRFETPFGTFVAPNISQHSDDGIGAWSAEDLANAMMRGVSPEGRHYYPAFPYASYARMQVEDVADLYAFMQSLPAVEGIAAPGDVGFPFNVRRGIGLWKRLFLDDQPAVALDDASQQVLRGQYLVEAMGHCGECHTPRNALGALDASQWLAGAAPLEVEGRPVPNISPGEDGIGGWSEDEIVALLESGFTPEFDSVGGTMAAVVRNLAELPADDREAIAAYLKAIPAHPNGY
ncbi:cytochrome c [Mesorhizobium sp. CAU 1741]|uniref:cytochrome c n=1 Tax=Mesorhizobium sp. CAU 1741 TaxID=3140366 RepID=UPI00325BF6C6